MKSVVKHCKDLLQIQVISLLHVSHSFFPLSTKELDEVKDNLLKIKHSKMCKIAKELLAVSKTPILEQLHSSISFVFRLWDGERKNSYVFKVFSRKDSKADFADIEERLSDYELNHSLLSTFSLYLENTRFFCFEGLHQITRQKAK